MSTQDPNPLLQPADKELFLDKCEFEYQRSLGIAHMTVGEMAKLTLAPQYGYGREGDPPKIPESATLIFEVELLSVIEPQEEVEARDPNVIDYDDLMLMADLDDEDW